MISSGVCILYAVASCTKLEKDYESVCLITYYKTLCDSGRQVPEE